MDTVTLQITQTATFNAAMKASDALCHEGKLIIEPEGLRFFGVEAGGAGAIEWKLGAEAFANYPELDIPFEIHVKPKEWVTAMKRVSKKDIATMVVGDDETTLLITDGVARRKVAFPLWDFTFQWASIPPHLTFTANVEMPPKRLVDAITDANEYGSSVELLVDGDVFKVSGLEDLKEKFSTSFAQNDEGISWNGSGKARFAGDLLLKTFNFGSEASTVFVAWKNDHPVKVGFTLPNFTLTAVLAPRVEQK